MHRRTDLGSSRVPALLWVHGGGHVLGAAAQDDPLLQDLVARTRCVAVAVERRRAPEDPYPAAVHDAYAALRWTAGEPWPDRERLVVGGASSGGGAAAGTALLARNRAEIALAGHVLVYPMLDERELTACSPKVRDPRIWNHESNRLGWAAYLSGLNRTAGGVGAEVPGYAAPARATDVRGLPPTWLATGELDLFREWGPQPSWGKCRVRVPALRGRGADRAARRPRCRTRFRPLRPGCCGVRALPAGA